MKIILFMFEFNKLVLKLQVGWQLVITLGFMEYKHIEGISIPYPTRPSSLSLHPTVFRYGWHICPYSTCTCVRTDNIIMTIELEMLVLPRWSSSSLNLASKALVWGTVNRLPFLGEETSFTSLPSPCVVNIAIIIDSFVCGGTILKIKNELIRFQDD